MITCPKCGCEEVENPDAHIFDQRLNIRAHKVQDKDGNWRSHCLKCDEWFTS